VGCGYPEVNYHVPVGSPLPDVGVSRFHVDHGSKLYYDPTVLFETQNQSREEQGERPQQPTTSQVFDSRLLEQHRGYSSPIRHQQANPYPSSGAPYGHISSPQIYDTSSRMVGQMSIHHPDPMSLAGMSMGGMGGMGRRITRGMGMIGDEGYMGI
jgi:hypothetical protein